MSCYGIGERNHVNDAVLIRRSHASYVLQFMLTLMSGFFWSWVWFNPNNASISDIDIVDAETGDAQQHRAVKYCQHQYPGFASNALGWIVLSLALLIYVQQSQRPRTLSARVNTMYAVISLLGLASYLFMNIGFDAWFGERYRGLCLHKSTTPLSSVVQTIFNAALFCAQLSVISYYVWLLRTDTQIDGDPDESDYED